MSEIIINLKWFDNKDIYFGDYGWMKNDYNK